LSELGASEARVAELEAAELEARQAFEALATTLSNRRQKAASTLSRVLESALAELAMPQCRVDVRIDPVTAREDWTPLGTDRVEMYFSPNPGEELRPLARIASGGELSRVMLALHGLAGENEEPRTIVFDEIDAGIGGAAADAVGARLQQLGRRHQVVCITHLPQVAARGDAHYAMTKTVRGGRTETSVRKLDRVAREQELARMIAGVEVSDQVRASAKELLDRRQAKGESEDSSKGESRSGAKAKGRIRGA
jgi:DNA repair protein RecN (Recombination protein N)